MIVSLYILLSYQSRVQHWYVLMLYQRSLASLLYEASK